MTPITEKLKEGVLVQLIVVKLFEANNILCDSREALELVPFVGVTQLLLALLFEPPVELPVGGHSRCCRCLSCKPGRRSTLCGLLRSHFAPARSTLLLALLSRHCIGRALCGSSF